MNIFDHKGFEISEDGVFVSFTLESLLAATNTSKRSNQQRLTQMVAKQIATHNEGEYRAELELFLYVFFLKPQARILLEAELYGHENNVLPMYFDCRKYFDDEALSIVTRKPINEVKQKLEKLCNDGLKRYNPVCAPRLFLYSMDQLDLIVRELYEGQGKPFKKVRERLHSYIEDNFPRVEHELQDETTEWTVHTIRRGKKVPQYIILALGGKKLTIAERAIKDYNRLHPGADDYVQRMVRDINSLLQTTPTKTNEGSLYSQSGLTMRLVAGELIDGFRKTQ